MAGFYTAFPHPWFTDPGTATLTSTNLARASTLMVLQAGTLNRISLNVSAITTNQPLRLSFQTLTAAGVPTGTLVGGSTSQTITPAVGLNEVTLGTGATVNAGDIIGIVIEWAGTAGSLTIPLSQSLAAKHAANTSGTWTISNSNASPQIAGRYTDNSYIETGALLQSLTSANYNINSAIDEYALKFVAQGAHTLRGAICFVGIPTAAFPTSPTLVLTNATTDAEVATAVAGTATNGAAPQGFFFLNPPTLVSGQAYRMSIRPQSSTNIGLSRMVFLNADAAAVSPFGGAGQLSTRADGGTWTDVPTEIPFISPVVAATIASATGGAPRGIAGTIMEY